MMELKEAIEIYNERFCDRDIKEFEEARNVILKEMEKRKPKEEYYKSSSKYDYYIELPYEKILLTNCGVTFKQCGYNGIAKRKGENEWVINHCQSYCNLSKEEIKEWLDSDIKNDDLEL